MPATLCDSACSPAGNAHELPWAHGRTVSWTWRPPGHHQPSRQGRLPRRGRRTRPRYTKLDLVRYYLSVADGALRGVAGRPMILKRFVKGITEEAIFQKRAPAKRPDWVEVAELHYARGTSAEEAVIHDAAGLAWVVNLGCVDLNPHPVRADDLDHPDELRIDLDPMPGVDWPQIVDVALVAREVLEDHGLVALAEDLRVARVPHLCPHRAALAVQAGAAGRRDGGPRGRAPAPGRWPPAGGGRKSGRACSSTSTRTPRTARSRRPIRCGRRPDARVSTPLTWDEVRRLPARGVHRRHRARPVRRTR